MKKAHTYCVFSLIILIFGIVFTISGVLLQSLPLSSKSALLVFSTAFIIVGITSFAVHYKKYRDIKSLYTGEIPIVAHWTYAPNSSNTLKTFIEEQKSSTLATALLILILALIFSIVFAYSGGTYILYLGYSLAILSFLIFIIARRFISAYYKHLLESELEVIFSEDSIYFLDEIHPLQKTFSSLEKIELYIGPEHLLIFDYGFCDVDEPSLYSVTIPVPQNQLKTATYLKHYYSDFIEVH